MSLPLRFWRTLGSIRVTAALCFLLTLDLAVGYVSLRANLGVFVPLGDVGLFDWLRTYGVYNPAATAWFFGLLALLAALAVNTFACTTERVLAILATGRWRRDWVSKFAPHVMHYAVLLILTGYVCSYLFSTSLPGRGLRAGESLRLPGGEAVTFLGFAPEVYRGERLAAFDGYVLRANARLRLDAAGKSREAALNFNGPVRFGGYGLYLNDFGPRKAKGGMRRGDFIRITLRRDPSAPVYLAGLALFALGLGLYLLGRGMKKANHPCTSHA